MTSRGSLVEALMQRRRRQQHAAFLTFPSDIPAQCGVHVRCGLCHRWGGGLNPGERGKRSQAAVRKRMENPGKALLRPSSQAAQAEPSVVNLRGGAQSKLSFTELFFLFNLPPTCLDF